jgi:hypothetical protein
MGQPLLGLERSGANVRAVWSVRENEPPTPGLATATSKAAQREGSRFSRSSKRAAAHPNSL